MRLKTLVLIHSFLFLTACAETQFVTHMGKLWGGEPAPQNQVNPNIPYKVGKPYQIDGRWYYPQENWGYMEEGLASWYGDEFQGRSTANGETFDKYALTAAHRTLPMPSLVRVTNLDNNRSAILRVNDRGPFKKDRIIDVSHEAARVLGFDLQGTARVRVELLSEESKRLAMAHGAQFPDSNYVSSPYNNTINQVAMDRPPSESSVTGSGMPFGSGGSFGNGPIETMDLDPPNMPLMARGGGDGFAPPPAPPDDFAMQPIIAPAGATEMAPAARPPAGAMPAMPPIQQQSQNLSNSVYLQVGAFADRQNVERLASRLKNLAEVEVTPLERGGRTLYRVRLGPLDNIQQAETLQTKVGEYGIRDAKIIIP
ncbi:MAG: septal ring lytic transglycosylase RlpA family protein [Alphaproteobacteria bacterium]|nr:MAG: septal ring lytic transglycosylase RlpA family protein [Alphaproteobacteria bacterium]